MTIRVTLSEYIQDVGVAVVAKNANASESTVKAWRYFNRVPRIKQAKLLMAKNANASESTVKAWRYFNRVPRIKQAKLLMRTSHGLLTWESIYGTIYEGDSDRAVRPKNDKAKNAKVA